MLRVCLRGGEEAFGWIEILKREKGVGEVWKLVGREGPCNGEI